MDLSDIASFECAAIAEASYIVTSADVAQLGAIIPDAEGNLASTEPSSGVMIMEYFDTVFPNTID